MEGLHVEAGHFDHVFDAARDAAGGLDVYDAETGRPVCLLRPRAIKPDTARHVWAELRGKVKAVPDNRKIAAGKGAAKRGSTHTNAIARDASTPSGVFKDASNEVIGFLNNDGRRHRFCRQSAFTAEHPEVWRVTVAFCRELDAIYRDALPDQWARQKAFADRLHPAYLIPGTVFSTVTVNRNWQTAYHFDAGDYSEGFGVMAQWRAGSFTGGDLVFPGYRFAVRYGAGDVCFANVHELHGVSRMIGLKGSWERLVGVFYLREGLLDCESPEAEIARIKRGKA